MIQSKRMAADSHELVRVIGIDPGLNITGYGVVASRGSEVNLLEAGVIRLPPSASRSLPARLESLFRELQSVMREFKPQAMCLEEVYSHADFPRTAILMGHARGVICLAAKLEGIPVLSFSAKRVKQTVTGNGNASKLQVQRAVQHYFALNDVPYPPDVADALAVTLCYVNATRAGNTAMRQSIAGDRGWRGEIRNSKFETRTRARATALGA